MAAPSVHHIGYKLCGNPCRLSCGNPCFGPQIGTRNSFTSAVNCSYDALSPAWFLAKGAEMSRKIRKHIEEPLHQPRVNKLMEIMM